MLKTNELVEGALNRSEVRVGSSIRTRCTVRAELEGGLGRGGEGRTDKVAANERRAEMCRE